MQHLQGDLQVVFDALYEIGVIEPVLKMDWKPALEKIESGSHPLVRALAQAVDIVNRCGSNRARLMNELTQLDRQSLEILAMEVAREYAGFHTRQELH